MSGGIIYPSTITTHFAKPNLDAFGRLRVSQPVSVWESYNLYDKNPLFMVEQTTGSATSTYDADASLVEMAVTGASGDKVVRQSREYALYEPGRGQQILLTLVPGAAGNNLRQRFGYFDDNNGLFFEQTNAGKFVVQRSSSSGSVVDTRIAQASWNLDTLDGSGPSGITIDWTKAQVAVVEFEWLGVGSAWLGFVLEGTIHYCHRFDNPNMTLATTYMATPNLPVRWEIENTGAGVAGTMSQICGVVFSETGTTPQGATFGADTGGTTTGISSGNTEGIIAIRAQSTAPNLIFRLQNATAVADTNDAFLVRIVYGPTVTGGTWNAVTGSRVEVNTTFTSFSGGVVQGAYYVAENSSISVPTRDILRPGNNVAGTSRDIILLSVTALSNGNFTGSLNWTEFE